jgi:hypothetical protein
MNATMPKKECRKKSECYYPDSSENGLPIIRIL